MFNELNKSHARTVKEGVDTDAMEFAGLKEFVGKTIKVDGFFFTTSGKYGKQVVVVGNGYKINMPKRAVETFESIAANEFMLKAVLDGKLELINITPVTAKNGNDTVAYELHDC